MTDNDPTTDPTTDFVPPTMIMVVIRDAASACNLPTRESAGVLAYFTTTTLRAVVAAIQTEVSSAANSAVRQAFGAWQGVVEAAIAQRAV